MSGLLKVGGKRGDNLRSHFTMHWLYIKLELPTASSLLSAVLSVFTKDFLAAWRGRSLAQIGQSELSSQDTS
jgi:hypothetical protein